VNAATKETSCHPRWSGVTSWRALEGQALRLKLLFVPLSTGRASDIGSTLAVGYLEARTSLSLDRELPFS